MTLQFSRSHPENCWQNECALVGGQGEAQRLQGTSMGQPEGAARFTYPDLARGAPVHTLGPALGKLRGTHADRLSPTFMLGRSRHGKALFLEALDFGLPGAWRSLSDGQWPVGPGFNPMPKSTLPLSWSVLKMCVCCVCICCMCVCCVYMLYVCVYTFLHLHGGYRTVSITLLYLSPPSLKTGSFTEPGAQLEANSQFPVILLSVPCVTRAKAHACSRYTHPDPLPSPETSILGSSLLCVLA